MPLLLFFPLMPSRTQTATRLVFFRETTARDSGLPSFTLVLFRSPRKVTVDRVMIGMGGGLYSVK